MKLNVLSYGIAYPESIQEILKRPAFRKATKNVALASAAIDKVLSSIQSIFTEHKSEFALVLTSKTGEIETTLDFLKTLHESKMARPLLFQNSLHNATAGFLAIQYGLHAPVVSVSASPFGEEQALELAETLIETEQCRYCLVVSVDMWPQFAGAPAKPQGIDASTCLILGKSEGIACIEDLEIQEKFSSQEELWNPIPQDQNIMTKLVEELSQGGTGGKIQMDKLQAGGSSLQWNRTL